MFRGDLAQVVDRLLRRGEGDGVAEPLAAGKYREHAALVFGQQVAGQLRFAQSDRLEVEVVQHGVFDAGIDQVAGEGLLPDALRHPQAADRGPQAVLQPAGIAADLSDPIARGNHGQDGLEIGPAQNLDPPLVDQLRQPVYIVRVMRGQPFHERAADVQRHPQRRIAAEDVQKRAIAVVEGLLEDVVEIADGLVIVQGENQTDAMGHVRLVAFAPIKEVGRE